MLLTFEATGPCDADGIVQCHRGTRCAARLEVHRLVAELAQGGITTGLERWIVAVA